MSKVTENILQPINKQKQKWSNIVLFGRREKEQIEAMSNTSFQKKGKLNRPNKPKTLDKINTFYLTERPFQTTETEKLSTIPTEAVTFHNTIHTEPNINDVNLLKAFEANTIRQSEDNKTSTKCKTQIDFKTKALNRKKESVQDFINKTRELILLKYTANIKQERAIRLKETYENEIESINDTIKSLNQAKNLFNDTFYVKFGDYVKHLLNQREIEKSKSTSLFEAMIRLKNEIAQIQGKIRKIEVDKTNVIRWLYFQIQLKEKLINLPVHYKKIIEQNEYNQKGTTDNAGTSNSSSNTERMIKRRNTKKLNTYRTFLTNEETERIKHYKAELIFNTPDEFLAQLKKYEDENIVLINKYNDLSDELIELNKEKKELEKTIEIRNNMEQSELELKEKELKALIDKNTSLLSEVKSLSHMEKSSPSQGGNKLFNQVLRKKIGVEESLLRKTYNKAKLYSRIYNLYKTTLELERIPGPNEKVFTKKTGSNEGEMLSMLQSIEISVDRLFGIFKYYYQNKNIYYDLLKKIKTTIEKEHKIEKAKKQREEQMMKLKNLKEQVEERNNKIYFKPRKKVDTYYQYVIKKEKKNNNDDDQFKEPLFTDFMYDILEDKPNN